MFPLRDNIALTRFPLVTVTLIALNVVVYVLSIRHGGDLFAGPSKETALRYGAIPFELTHSGHHCAIAEISTPLAQPVKSFVVCPDSAKSLGAAPSQPATWQTVFTSIFVNGSFAAIFANTIALAIFGPNIEDATGRARFLAFYLLGGIVTIAAAVLLSPSSTVPTLAAGGATAAVLGGYLLLYPRARVLALVFVVFFGTIVELPALALAGAWLLAQLCFAATGLANPVDGDWALAYAALIVSFVFGLALIRLFVNAARACAKGRRTPPRAVY
jgi:membrane associated rhomboid family serine protease